MTQLNERFNHRYKRQYFFLNGLFKVCKIKSNDNLSEGGGEVKVIKIIHAGGDGGHGGGGHGGGGGGYGGGGHGGGGYGGGGHGGGGKNNFRKVYMFYNRKHTCAKPFHHYNVTYWNLQLSLFTKYSKVFKSHVQNLI